MYTVHALLYSMPVHDCVYAWLSWCVLEGRDDTVCTEKKRQADARLLKKHSSGPNKERGVRAPVTVLP